MFTEKINLGKEKKQDFNQSKVMTEMFKTKFLAIWSADFLHQLCIIKKRTIRTNISNSVLSGCIS